MQPLPPWTGFLGGGGRLRVWMRWCHPLCNSAHGLSVSSGPFMHLPNDISKVSSDHRCPPLYPIVGRHWVTRDYTFSLSFARVD